MSKLLSLLTLFLFLSNTNFSQDTISVSRKNTEQHYFGLSAGTTTGIGFSYKYLKNRFGLQLTGIPIFADGGLWASGGIGLTWRSKKAIAFDERLLPLLYAGTSVMMAGNNINNAGVEFASVGIGFGLDYTVSDRFIFNLMTGYGLYVANEVRTHMAIEAGLHYKL